MKTLRISALRVGTALALCCSVVPIVAAEGPLEPKEALRAFKLEPGLRIDLVAVEPVVASPVALAFDESGRIYVAENRGYPTGPPAGEPPAGIIAVLEDTDGDGAYDTRKVFADGLTFPNGVLPWKGGLFVTCAPDLLYLKDTDGDGRADLRRVVFTGFNASNTTQLRVSHPTLGPDNWIYLTSGLSGGKITAPDQPDKPALELKTDFRFRPETGEFEAADSRAQFGMTFDDFGRRFICYNRVHVQHVVISARDLSRNSHLAFSQTVQDCPEVMTAEPLQGHGAAARIFPISDNITTADSHAGTFTAACAVHVYRGDALPEQFRGNVFACDPTGNLVHRDLLAPRGATFVARRAAERTEMVASTDNWFRPVFLATGPDGALYICDMYRRTIEHPQYLPEEIRKRTDFDSGKGRGRIYRLSASDASAAKLRSLQGFSTDKLVAALAHPNGWWRDTAQRLLVEKHDPAAVALLKGVIAAADQPHPGVANARTTNHEPRTTNEPHKGMSAVQRFHALWTLRGLAALGETNVAVALSDPHPGVREAALPLSQPWIAESTNLATKVTSLASDPDARVRFRCALTLGSLSGPQKLPALAQIALRGDTDPWTRAAVISSVAGQEAALLRLLFAQQRDGHSADDTSDKIMAPMYFELGRIIGVTASTQEVAVLRQEVVHRDGGQFVLHHLPALHGFVEGTRSRPADRAASVALLFSDAITNAATTNLFQQFITVATNRNRPLELRLAAIGVLSEANFDSAGPALLDLMRPGNETELQKQVITSLSRWPDDRGITTVATPDHWDQLTPGLRQFVVTRLLGQPRHTAVLLQLLEKRLIAPALLTQAQRKQLLSHRDPDLKQRAEQLFKAPGGQDRMKVYEEYKPVLSLTSDSSKGKAVFKQHCSICHRLDREGNEMGPDLFGVRNQPKEALLLHILVPNAEVIPGFNGYTVETRDGRVLSGLIASETASSITLRQPVVGEEPLPRNQIVTLTANALSMMPDEIERSMSRQDLADLIGYLKGE